MSELVFQQLVESAPHIAVRGCDPQRRIVFWNAGCERQYGYTVQQALDARVDDLIVDDANRRPLVEALDDAQRTGVAPVPGALQLRHRSGTPVLVQSSHVLRPDRRGGFLVYSIDVDLAPVTQRDAALRDAAQAEARGRRMRSELLALLAHELRTPLVGIQGFSELLMLRARTDDERDYVEPIQRSAMRLTRLVESVIEASDLAIRDADCDVRAVALRPMLDEVVEHCREAVDGFGGAIRTEASIDTTSVLADAGRLARILGIVVGNAMKFAPRGLVRIDSENHDDGTVTIGVEDDGPGIDAANAARLFEPFHGAEAFATRSAEGAGLGLYIARRHARAMQGELVLADPARARFELRLRAAPGQR